MAIRNIVKDTDGYDTLHKKCRPVTDFNQKLWDLLDDMAQTMYKAQGVGLAGPQVGMLRRVFVIDVGEGILEFVNPEILETSGTQEGAVYGRPQRWWACVRPSGLRLGTRLRRCRLGGSGRRRFWSAEIWPRGKFLLSLPRCKVREGFALLITD